MKIALTTTAPDVLLPFPFSLLEGDFPTRLQKAARLGYDGVELVVLQPDQLDPGQIKRQVEAAGLKIAAIASGAQAYLAKLTLLAADDQTRARAYERLLALIGFAAETGAPVVTIGSFRGRVAAGQREQAYADLVSILCRACSAAAEHAVRLAIEPLNRYETELVFNAAEGQALIDAVGHAQLGLLLDTFHMNIEEASFCETIRSVVQAGRLWHVHIADSNRLALGQGHIPFDEIFTMLNELGYAGYCSAELLNRPTPDIAAKKTIDFCRPYLARG